MKRAQPEALIQRTLLEHLRLRGTGWVVWATPNAARRSPAMGAMLKAHGMVPGVGDLSLVRFGDGKYFELELKSDHGRLSSAQRERKLTLEQAGATYGVAFGLNDALELMQQWGAIR